MRRQKSPQYAQGNFFANFHEFQNAKKIGKVLFGWKPFSVTENFKKAKLMRKKLVRLDSTHNLYLYASKPSDDQAT